MAKGRGLFLYSSSCPSHQSGFPRHSKLISASGPLHFHFLCRDHTSIRFCRAASSSHTHLSSNFTSSERPSLFPAPDTHLKPISHTPQTNIDPVIPHLSHYPVCCLHSWSLSEGILILVCYLFTCWLSVSPRHREAAKDSAWHTAGA